MTVSAADRMEADQWVDDGPNLGASQNEPGLRELLMAYYSPFFHEQRAKDLTDAYLAAIRSTQSLTDKPRVGVTDEMVERATKELLAYGEFSSILGNNEPNARVAARAALEAALPSGGVRVRVEDYEELEYLAKTYAQEATAIGDHPAHLRQLYKRRAELLCRILPAIEPTQAEGEAKIGIIGHVHPHNKQNITAAIAAIVAANPEDFGPYPEPAPAQGDGEDADEDAFAALQEQEILDGITAAPATAELEVVAQEHVAFLCKMHERFLASARTRMFNPDYRGGETFDTLGQSVLAAVTYLDRAARALTALRAERERLERERDALREANEHANRMQRLTMDRRQAAEARVSELEKALEPFARIADTISPGVADKHIIEGAWKGGVFEEVRVGDFRRARAALQEEEGGKNG